jgi:serine protease Do
MTRPRLNQLNAIVSSCTRLTTAQRSRICTYAALLCSLLATSVQSWAAEIDFSTYYNLIYQVKVVANGTSSKSSIGSGFQVSPDGLIITNYHVVSHFVNAPKDYEIQYLDQAGNTGNLTLLDFDVINDIAILQHPNANPEHFKVNYDPVPKGELIYALGNPHDLGITLVFGAYNGMVEHSYDPQILFSGSLNPGMSGGPGLNTNAEVIGINVATAGSQLSFLVPAARIRALRDAQRNLASDNYQQEITNQVKRWQQARLGSLLEQPWNKETLGQHLVVGEIRNDIQCWGSSNKEDTKRTISSLRRTCNSSNRLYISNRLTTGQVHFSFEQASAKSLGSYRFHHQLSRQNLAGDNRVNKDSVTPYHCNDSFIEQSAANSNWLEGSYNKLTYCVRAYKELEGLYDVLLLAENNGDNEAFSAHFTLAGVDEALAQAFTDKFLTELAWK